MTINEELLSKGWHLSETGLALCKEGLEKTSSVLTIIQKARDIDLKDIGAPFLSDEIQKGKVENVSGPCVLQIQKLKNVASPKYEASNNHVLLRLLLTDGHAYISCLQWDAWKSVNLDTPPGSKLFIKSGKVQVQNGFLLLKDSQFILLGGQVAHMVEKWELSKQFALHQRRGQGSEDGPPPWIPFGKSINYKANKVSSGNFRSLDPEVKKEEKEDAVFKQQRMANIAEISRSKEGKKKVFGGGKDYAANENTLNSTLNACGQERKYFYDDSDIKKTSNQPQVLKQSEKKQYVEPPDNQGKSYDLENKNALYKPVEDYNLKNVNFQQHRETNQYTENAKFGGLGNNSQKPMFYRNPAADFHQRENKSDNYFHSNAPFGHSKFQEKANRPNENPACQINHDNLSFNVQITQDRQNYSYAANSYRGDNRFNHNGGYHNSPANRRGINRRDEMAFHSNLAPEPFSEDHFPVPEFSQEKSHFSGVLEFRRGGNRPFIHRNDENNQDKQRDRPPRHAHRPSTRLYQPPRQRRG